jgi:hypothetical protein
MNQRFPFRRPGIWVLGFGIWDFFQEQAFDGASARHAMAEQTRWKDPRVVYNEQVTRLKITAELDEHRVLEPVVTVQDKEARTAADFGRMLRDELVRQIEVEVGCVHRSGPASLRSG